MTEFQGKVAVITGAASGIGRGLGKHCAQEGMKVVLADIAPGPLHETAAELRALAADVLVVRTDVSKASDVEALLQLVLKTFGAVHLLCNNAGVISVEDTALPLWEAPLSEWQRLIDVNLCGVIHGLHFFVPVMLEQDTECHIVNTASSAGIAIGEYFGIYRMTKHAVVSLSETLHHQLTACGAKLRVSVLCPSWVSTNIGETEVSRYNLSLDPHNRIALDEQPVLQAGLQSLRTGMAPSQVAETVFQALRAEIFYIFTHPESTNLARTRLENIIQGRISTPDRTG